MDAAGEQPVEQRRVAVVHRGREWLRNRVGGQDRRRPVGGVRRPLVLRGGAAAVGHAGDPAADGERSARGPAASRADSDTIALATFERDAGQRNTTGIHALDPGDSFVVRAQCLAEAAGVAIQYTVLADGMEQSSAGVPCDGWPSVNSVILPGGDATQYEVRLESETFDQVIEAYAAVVPE